MIKDYSIIFIGLLRRVVALRAASWRLTQRRSVWRRVVAFRAVSWRFAPRRGPSRSVVAFGAVSWLFAPRRDASREFVPRLAASTPVFHAKITFLFIFCASH